MDVSIIGSGAVGKHIGKYFAGQGHSVIFYDVKKEAFDGLDTYRCTSDIEEAVAHSKISFVAVPTNLEADKRHFDYSHLESVGRALGESLERKNEPHTVVLKSTVTPGTTRKKFIPSLRGHRDVVYSPEFLTVISGTWTQDKKFEITPVNEGKIVMGFEEGHVGKEFRGYFAYKDVQSLYEDINTPFFITNFETAEAAKLIANARLALAISFSNQVTELLKKSNRDMDHEIDVEEAMSIVHADPRIGEYGSVFGKAYGGPCFKKDLPVIAHWLKEMTGEEASLIAETIGINTKMAELYGVRE